MSISRVGDLEAKHRAIWSWDGKRGNPRQPPDDALRTHRAIRWLGRAEREYDSGDLDVAFILYWIALNAAYGKDLERQNAGGERGLFADYLRELLRLDTRGAIENSLWDELHKTVTNLLKIKYLYQPFWRHANGEAELGNWQARFERANKSAMRALGRRATRTALAILFDRLYTLRNQLVHGGATWNSSINRDSVRDGAGIMRSLVPIFVEVMLDNPEIDWGPAWYPPGLQGTKRARS